MMWREVQGFPNYMVSNTGIVRNSRGRIMKLRTSYRGYSEVGLRNGGQKQKMLLVHRLVAFAFIDKPNGKDYVNHKDGNKANNDVSNLEWVTQSENSIHAIRTGLLPITEKCVDTLRRNAIAKRTPIRVVNDFLGIDAVYPSIAKAASELPCNEKTLRNVLKKRNTSRLGYKVTYV